ncbi:MAG: hypothetical protein IJ509_00545 [Bacilli bacterium]|nr:hypothetical protein [Bacilli bacterium]
MTELEKNYEKFTDWYDSKIEKTNSSYPKFYMNKEEIKALAEKIANYYEEKYHNELLEKDDKVEILTPQTKYFLEKEINLTPKESNTLNANYSSSNWYFSKQNEECKVIYCIYLPNKHKRYERAIIYFDEFGRVKAHDISGLNDILPNKKKNTTLIHIYNVITKKQPSYLDYSELEKVITNYRRNMDIKKIIIILASINLIYSKNTTKTKGFIRTKQMINDFNKVYKLNLNMSDIKALIKEEVNNQNTLQSIYDNYLEVFYQTGRRPYPDKLLALLLLQEKNKYEPLRVSEGKFYEVYKKDIDKKIAQIIRNFKITKEDMIHYIEEKGIAYKEETYEHDKIWTVFAEGFGTMHWTIMYHPSYTPEKAYFECLSCYHDEKLKKTKTNTRTKTLEKIRRKHRGH